MPGDEEHTGGYHRAELEGRRTVCSNIFIFALAGHETSAHSLAFAFAYLALNPEKQDWLLEELLQVMPAGHAPVSDGLAADAIDSSIEWYGSRRQTYKDYPRLERCLAVLHETLRLHPPVTIIPKMALEDTYLPDDDYPLLPLGAAKDRSTQGERRKVFIPKGSHVHIDTTALRE